MTDDGFTPDEARLLGPLLDAIIPPSHDGRLPAAGSLGLLDALATRIRATPMLQPVVEYGLGALAAAAAARNPDGWPALTPAERTAVLAEFAAADQFFMPAFLFVVYAAYYEHPRVVTALGLEPRPPHPQGYAMDADDDLDALLARVRARGAIHRG